MPVNGDAVLQMCQISLSSIILLPPLHMIPACHVSASSSVGHSQGSVLWCHLKPRQHGRQ